MNDDMEAGQEEEEGEGEAGSGDGRRIASLALSGDIRLGVCMCTFIRVGFP